MANVYVDSNAVGAGTGADWANAYTTLAAALTAKAAGDDFWVAHNHAETQASAMTLTSPGSSTAPCRIVCVNSGGSVPPAAADLRTTATVTTTSGSNISFGGFAYCYGITFSAGSGAVTSSINFVSSAALWWVLEACKLVKAGTSASLNAVQLGTNAAGITSKLTLKNTTMQFGNTGDSVSLRGELVWLDTPSNAIAGATLPTTLFNEQSGSLMAGNVELRGVDLSALSGTIFGAMRVARRCYLNDCKLHASATIAATPFNQAGTDVVVSRSDSSGANYRHERYQYAGTQTVETTIVRTGGASDGATALAWKIITTANAKRYAPFESLPIAVWNDTVGSQVTATVYGIWGGGAVPNNDEVWLDAEYLGSGASPLASFATGGPATQLTAGSALTSDSSTWGGSTTAFKMTVSFTPNMAGWVYMRVRAAKASSTFYVDPKAVLA